MQAKKQNRVALVRLAGSEANAFLWAGYIRVHVGTEEGTCPHREGLSRSSRQKRLPSFSVFLSFLFFSFLSLSLLLVSLFLPPSPTLTPPPLTRALALDRLYSAPPFRHCFIPPTPTPNLHNIHYRGQRPRFPPPPSIKQPSWASHALLGSSRSS